MKKFLFFALIIAQSCTAQNKTDTGFYIEKSTITTSGGTILLKDHTGHCHTLESVQILLKSDVFRKSNPTLTPRTDTTQI